MLRSKFLFPILIFLTLQSFGQNQQAFMVVDSTDASPLFGAKIILKGTNQGVTTDDAGKAILDNIPNGPQIITVSYIGYLPQEFHVTYPTATAESIQVFLISEVEEIEEVLVEATRANRSIASLPTRTEVLTEEIDEAASMEPSKIGHLITHSTGIQVQTTSAASNGAVVRIQGLNGRYTQMLQDGFPLYGGFSGSLDILQIPPLDLRQVEYIKGSASTLYGGGAIGGLINLLTKKADKEETLLHLNMSSIGAKDFNAFVSRKINKFGFTNLASLHLQSPYDADKDGYSDVPEVNKFNFNPKLFYYPDNKTEMYLGTYITAETRNGGDMRLIADQTTDTIHFYFDKQKTKRFTSQFSAKRKLNESSTLTAKNSVSKYHRYITIRQNKLGEQSAFAGDQTNSFSELNYNFNKTRHNLNAGLNLYTYDFKEQVLDTNQLRNQNTLTYGAYINHLWDMREKIAVESGLRTDYARGKSILSKNTGELFVLPRLSMLYKANRQVSFRLSGGMGYRMPSVFSAEAEPFGYQNVQAVDFYNVQAERSYGGNVDFKYQTTFGSENLLFTFNQMFFYNMINNPIVLLADSVGLMSYQNNGGTLDSRGFESQIKFTFWQFTWFFGYTYTDAFLKNGNYEQQLTLTPQHSIKGDLLFVVENKWRIGWDYEYKSEQLLSNKLKSPSLFTTGIVVERTIGNFVIFLNAENFTDTRQTRYESLLSGPYDTPQFTEVWAPLDGFFFNAGLKIKLD